jgi:hypothetical protein
MNYLNNSHQRRLKTGLTRLVYIIIIWQLSICFYVFSEDVHNNAVVTFTNLYSQKLMSADDFGCDNGSNVSQWELDNFLLNKLFVLLEVGGGYYKIKAFHCKDKFLESDGSSCKNGTNVRLWNMDKNTANKFWRIEKTNSDSNSYIIYNVECVHNFLLKSRMPVKIMEPMFDCGRMMAD